MTKSMIMMISKAICCLVFGVCVRILILGAYADTLSTVDDYTMFLNIADISSVILSLLIYFLA